jgi:hypothetical protein
LSERAVVTVEAGDAFCSDAGACGANRFFRFLGGCSRWTDFIGTVRGRATLASCMIGPTATCLVTAGGAAGGCAMGFLRSMLSAMRGGIGATRRGAATP